ncbi:hypothetical protein K4B79_10645 [Streptomyces lincolnensis]|uniref:DddA-like double-stranded DNA deaminase toxin n=1 Tax=Streptomyces lincolnensis TaxID=1915 RepID=UPI0035AC2980|nr:hypothetical protein [Streptomyces lincolnensis]
MSGALYLEGYDDSIPLSSGRNNLKPGYVNPPGSGSFHHHLEAQAAAEMRKTRSKLGCLYITGDYICGACNDRLPRMLPRGATLEVTYKDGTGKIQTVPYRGE